MKFASCTGGPTGDSGGSLKMTIVDSEGAADSCRHSSPTYAGANTMLIPLLVVTVVGVKAPAAAAMSKSINGWTGLLAAAVPGSPALVAIYCGQRWCS